MLLVCWCLCFEPILLTDHIFIFFRQAAMTMRFAELDAFQVKDQVGSQRHVLLHGKAPNLCYSLQNGRHCFCSARLEPTVKLSPVQRLADSIWYLRRMIIFFSAGMFLFL